MRASQAIATVEREIAFWYSWSESADYSYHEAHWYPEDLGLSYQGRSMSITENLKYLKHYLN